VVECCQGRRVWTGDDPSQKHILRFVTDVRRKVEAYEGNDADRGLLSRLLIGVRVEEVHAQTEYIATLPIAQAEMLPIRPLELTKEFAVKYVVQGIRRRAVWT
jgi:hypothetical protein